MEKDIDATEVMVYLCRIQGVRMERNAILSRVAPVYAERSRRFFDKGTVVAEASGLRELVVGMLLAAVLGVTKDEQLVYGPYGKPALVEGSSCFNISHSDDLVVLAVSDTELGVDVEPIPTKLARYRLLALGRLLGIEHRRKADPAPELVARAATPLLWAREWTRAEAILKAMGTGLSLETTEYLPLMKEWHCTWKQAGCDMICVAARNKPVLRLVNFDVRAWLCV